MLKVFGQTDKSFNSNGDVVLQPLRARVHKEDNGDYYLDVETGLEYLDYLVEGNIIIANTPQGDQAFRITNPIKNKSKVSIKAWHVFYDSARYLIHSVTTDFGCDGALHSLNANTEPQSEFTIGSDITDIKHYHCSNKSLFEAIKDVLEIWGGHLVRDNFDIQVKKTIGQDNGVTVRYGKNIEDITCEENWDAVVTKLLPVGKDNILLNAVNPSASIYVTSTQQYDIPYTKTVTFSQDINREDYSSDTAYKTALVNDLRNKAQAYVNANCYPHVSYTLKANPEAITDIGDTVEVIDERLGVDLLTKVTSYDYDCILDKYVAVNFGNPKNTLGNLITNITSLSNNNTTQQINADVGGDVASIFARLSALEQGVKIMTGSIERGVSGMTADAYNKITLDTEVSNGDGFIISDGGIKIGSGISMVLLSAQVDFALAGTSGYRALKVTNGTETVAMAWNTASQESIVTASVLVPVAENDVLYLYAQPHSGADLISTCALTVQAI